MLDLFFFSFLTGCLRSPSELQDHLMCTCNAPLEVMRKAEAIGSRCRADRGMHVHHQRAELPLPSQVYEGNSSNIPGISLGGVAVSRLSHALNAVLVAALMWTGAVSFKKVLKEQENQLAYAFQVIQAVWSRSLSV